MKKIDYFFKCAVFLLTGILFACADDDLQPDATVPKPRGNQTTVVSIDEAQTTLERTLSEMQQQATRSGETFEPRRIANKFSSGSPVTRSGGEVEPFLHVFNFEDNRGYAIMSGDSRVAPLLALAETGAMTPDAEVENSGVAVFLGNLKGYFNREIETHENLIASAAADGYTTEISPWGGWYTPMHYGYCQVQWGQRSPYNKFCPPKTPVGCSATAVAQLMTLYKYPSGYNGYTFDWDLMRKHIKYVPPLWEWSYIPAHDAIARLMQQLGLPGNLNMNYGTVESTSSTNNVPITLRNFGYSSGGTIRSYTTELAVGELNKPLPELGYPVLIRGDDTRNGNSYSGGHIWLGHGISWQERTITIRDQYGFEVSSRKEEQWYILCNFGWNGSKDGYYVSGVFDTTKGPDPDLWWKPTLPTRAAVSSNIPNYFQYNIKIITGIRR